jgi:methyl-accepting chemotaxis protein
VLLFFVALYSLFLFINYPEKKESFFLSLSALFFGIYLLNVTVFDSSIPYLFLKASLYACFPVSIIFLFRFFRVFFAIRTPDRIMWIVTGIGVVFAGGYFFQSTTATLDGWHSLMILYPVSGLMYAFVGVTGCLRKGQWEKAPILIGLVIAVLFSAWDIYFFIGNHTPFILLQGLGFMSLILGTFYSFSQEIADTNKKCSLFSVELQGNKQTRDSLFRKIQDDTVKSESASSLLNLSIDRVGSLVTQYLASIEQINADIETQGEQIRANKKNVEKIFQAINETSGMVGQHEALVEVTVRNVQALTEDIHRTDQLVNGSGDIFRKLTEVCLAADRDVAESSRFVDDLASYSSNINEIVKSISDLAEQTNILSINAAIEAARSGLAGKGFAVVAGEIRSLANKSSQSAAQINVILGTMVEKIRNIQRQEDQVSRRLKDIIGENRQIDDALALIFGVLRKQLERNAVISKSVSELVDTVHRTDKKPKGEQFRSRAIPGASGFGYPVHSDGFSRTTILQRGTEGQSGTTP